MEFGEFMGLAVVMGTVNVLDRLVDYKFRRIVVLGQIGGVAVFEPLPGFIRDPGLLLPVVRTAIALSKGTLESAPRRQRVRRIAQMPFA